MDDFFGSSEGNTPATNSHSKDGSLDAALIDLVPIPPDIQSWDTNSENSDSGKVDDPLGSLF